MSDPIRPVLGSAVPRVGFLADRIQARVEIFTGGERTVSQNSVFALKGGNELYKTF